MNYLLGYDERSADTFIDRGAEQQCLNLAPFVHRTDEGSASEAFDRVLSALRARLASTDSLVTSNEPLNNDLRAALRRKVALSNEEYARVNTLITLYIRKFHGDAQPKVEWMQCPGSHPGAWEPNTLYGRYGIVELRVLENWLQDKEGLLVEYRKVVEQYSDEAYMYRGQASRHWLSSDDKNYNLRALMTNAGFYPALAGGGEDLNCWAEEYLAALAASKRLFSVPGGVSFLLRDTRAPVCQKWRDCCRLHQFPRSDGVLLHARRARRVIRDAVRSGGGRDFRHGAAVSALHRYRHSDILAAYVAVTHIDVPEPTPRLLARDLPTIGSRYRCGAFRERPFSLFFAASGCYGMPLCRYVYRRYGCASVYYGNHLNTLFGVRMACNDNFLSGRRNLQYWTRSGLSAVKNVDRIDGGRYT